MSTVSENMRTICPVFISSTQLSTEGPELSAVNRLAWRDLPSVTATVSTPLGSSAIVAVTVIYEFTTLVHRLRICFTRLRSSMPRNTVTVNPSAVELVEESRLKVCHSIGWRNNALWRVMALTSNELPMIASSNVTTSSPEFMSSSKPTTEGAETSAVKLITGIGGRATLVRPFVSSASPAKAERWVSLGPVAMLMFTSRKVTSLLVRLKLIAAEAASKVGWTSPPVSW